MLVRASRHSVAAGGRELGRVFGNGRCVGSGSRRVNIATLLRGTEEMVNFHRVFEMRRKVEVGVQPSLVRTLNPRLRCLSARPGQVPLYTPHHNINRVCFVTV